MELAATITRKKTMIRRVQLLTVGLSVVYIVLSVAIYLSTNNYIFVIFLAFVNEILLLVGFWKCPLILFDTVTSKPKKIHVKKRSAKILSAMEEYPSEDGTRGTLPFQTKTINDVSLFFQKIQNTGAVLQKYTSSSHPKCNLNIVKKFAFRTKTNLFFCLLSSAGYLATQTIPSTGPSTFLCSIFMFLAVLAIHWDLLLFLLGTLD